MGLPYITVHTINIPCRYVILGIVSYDENPCLKFELMGCEVDPAEPLHLGFNNGYPVCVDNEPPAFLNCPTYPIEVCMNVILATGASRYVH